MIVLETNYSKKLGLPGYSSHQFSITLKTEIADLAQVQTESNRLYQLLQQSVDASIKEVGFLPTEVPIQNRNGNGNGNGHHNGNDTWECSDKQKALILKIVEEHKLDKKEIEALAQDRFGKGVKALNKLEASQIIEILLQEHSDNNKGNGRRFGSRYQKAGAK
ncbi:hypothetical protein NXS98_06130 [Fontisphaera persica]|uniref:hypothetical protein n=1 Tax=Fontisphaera persica TaxID=2974023 RepID=UPI0024C05379|nr:hypothetical protein [Fontisphaera persica]WCJ60702.1 hypothetical protein NXS98_06130 [Fontisphaera persica]